MITKQKIDIYRKHQGDIDGLIRCGRKEKDLIQENDWSLIDSTLQDLELIEKGLCSNEYKNRFKKLLVENFDTVVIELIKKMS